MPIDVGTGAVHLEVNDVTIGGRFPMIWGRSFQSSLIEEKDSHFGPGWTGPFFARLTRLGKDYHFRTGTGGLIVFPDPEEVVSHLGTIRDKGSFHEITRHGNFLKVAGWTEHGKVTRYNFLPDSFGRGWKLHSLENASEEGVELSWDEQGRLKGLRQKREKRTLAVTYLSTGRIGSVSFRHPNGHSTLLARYEYNSDGRLSAVHDALGFACRYDYDQKGRLSREVAKDGGVFTYKYDDHNRCISYSGLDGYDLKALRFLDHAAWTEVTDSVGSVRRYEWLPTGQIVREIDPLGASFSSDYDSFGRLISKTDPLGAKTLFEYDEAGNRSKVTNALGETTAYEYNESHLVTCRIDANENRWERKYDAFNRLISESGPLGLVYSIGYDSMGNPVEIRESGDGRLLRKFADNGDMLETTDWSGRKTSFSRDDFGRVAQRKNPDGTQLSFRFDMVGRLIEAFDATGRRYRFEYDAVGNLTGKSGTTLAATRYRYGTCHRLLEENQEGASSVRYRWGSEPGRLLGVTNERDEKYSFEYDANGQVRKEIGFDGTHFLFDLDLAGRCIRKVNALGTTIEWILDPVGRPVEEILENGESARFYYDKLGNIVAAENPFSKLEFTRDPAGRITEEFQNGFGIRRKYGSRNEISSLETDVGVRLEYSYDLNGWVESIDVDGMGSYAFTRAADGQATNIDLPGGFRWEHDYDSRSRLLRQSLGSPGSTAPGNLLQREYAYYDNDLLHVVEDSIWGEVQYKHDSNRRLVGFNSDSLGASYRLDGAGDPISWMERTGKEIHFEYGPGGALRSRGHDKFAYDGAGRMVIRGLAGEGKLPAEQVMSWDAQDRLRGLTTPDGETWEYLYDPFGRRISKKNKDRETRFIWNGNSLLHEIVSGKAAVTWGFEPDSYRPLFKIDGDNLYSILCDHLGTPREMLSMQGEFSWRMQYDPWGNALQGKGDANDCPFRFAGQYLDAESGLHYNTFRYYDPRGGRYISQDPIRLHGGTSLYQYVKNPLHWIDPFGLCPEDEKGKKDGEQPGEKPAKTTPIYRLGSGTNTNLTPREKDTTGLSYMVTKPEGGKYTQTTLEAVNGTGVLKAVQDGPNHVSVTPADPTKMQGWIDSRPQAESDPHPLTTTLKDISVKPSS